MSIAERVKQKLEESKKIEIDTSKTERIRASNAKWKIFQSRYLYPSLSACVFLGVYYMFQAFEMKYEAEEDQEQKMQETYERDKSTSRVGFFKLKKERDVEQKAEELETKVKKEDYDMKVVPLKDKE